MTIPQSLIYASSAPDTTTCHGCRIPVPAVRPALSVAPESQSRREGSSWPQESLQTHLLPIGNDLVHTKMHKTVHNAMWISLYLEALFWESPKKLWYCQVSSLTGEKLCTFSFVAEAEESVPFIKQYCVTIIQKEGSTITYNIIWVKWHKRYPKFSCAIVTRFWLQIPSMVENFMVPFLPLENHTVVLGLWAGSQ